MAVPSTSLKVSYRKAEGNVHAAHPPKLPVLMMERMKQRKRRRRISGSGTC